LSIIMVVVLQKSESLLSTSWMRLTIKSKKMSEVYFP